MADFHFIRPLWLLAIIALFFMLFLLKKMRLKRSGWQQLLPTHLAKVLVTDDQAEKSRSLLLPFFIGLLSIIAMAGPSWQKLPQPVYQVAKGSVLIMDMSYSMYATDVAPNRLTRARYKAIDLLDSITDGEVGLIAYAGDAFSISPLTDDSNNIKLLLPSLSPELMPVLGSNPFAALSLAHDMLINAGHNQGDIYWFTDGVDNIDIQDITQWSRKYPYRLNILGIGTTAGAPISLPNGELMKDDNGAIIVPKLTEQALRGLAKRGRGNYTRLSHDNRDIEQLTAQPFKPGDEQTKASDNTGDQWQEFGPYLLLLVLAMLLPYFRRGALLAVLPFVFMVVPNQQVQASIWQDLWQTKDQQAQTLFDQQAYQQAADKFNDPLWQGSAYYKAGDYQQALSAFKQHDSAQAWYNQGNALAKLQKIDEAIAAYQQALTRDPNLTDAKTNKDLLEQLKQQQENQQQNSGDEQQQQDNQEQQDQQDQQQNGEQSGDSQDSESPNSENQSQASDSQPNQQQQDSAGQDSPQQSQENNSAEQADNEQPTEQASAEDKQPAQAEQQAKPKQDVEGEQEQASAAAQAQAKQLDKETEQKHQQLLNKVTDDPYLLLRNKMQLEYQKRHQDRRNVGVKKKW
ncbi:Ca-activated chloride channel family protein [Colwellia chukchiensis]|uniref:Ca-activated chloride channel family protein n=1 Tax=Colwellia chukchiensis TaxID=641665 RepID=A0A1H7H5E4_9GAMM|nr:VWA domain-containing protein [Colwellia chukchiensis]SEK45616.1 Ca-activated chloride channel family protein [Colwellia chukchiensis]